MNNMESLSKHSGAPIHQNTHHDCQGAPAADIPPATPANPPIDPPKSWIFYIVTTINTISVPLAAMTITDHGYSFLSDMARITSLLTNPAHHPHLAAEKTLAETYYLSMKSRSSVMELRDQLLERSCGMILPFCDGTMRGLREFPYTSTLACGGMRGWEAVPLETVRRTGNRTYALAVWDISDLGNVKFGVVLPKSDVTGVGRVVRMDHGGYEGRLLAVEEVCSHLDMMVDLAPELQNMALVKPEALDYVSDPSTPLPKPSEQRPQQTTLVDQAVINLIKSTNSEHIPQSSWELCRSLPAFRPTLRRILEARPELITQAAGMGHVVAAAFEGDEDINLLRIHGISAEALSVLVKSDMSKKAKSLTLLEENIIGTPSEVASALEATRLEIRIMHKPGCKDDTSGKHLARYLDANPKFAGTTFWPGDAEALHRIDRKV